MSAAGLWIEKDFNWVEENFKIVLTI